MEIGGVKRIAKKLIFYKLNVIRLIIFREGRIDVTDVG